MTRLSNTPPPDTSSSKDFVDYESKDYARYESMARANGVEFVRVDGLFAIFQNATGEQFKVRNSRLKDGWPDNLAVYLKFSSRSSMSGDEKLEELRVIAREQGAELLDTQWQGWAHRYSFKSADGQVIRRRVARVRAEQSLKKTLERARALFDEFKQRAAMHGAEVLIEFSQWKNVKTYYPVRQADGCVIQVMPNSSEYSGWPHVPLFELQARARPYSVRLVSEPNSMPQVFEVDFQFGLVSTGTFQEILGVLKHMDKIDALRAWLAVNEYTMLSCQWLDPSRLLRVRSKRGIFQTQESPLIAMEKSRLEAANGLGYLKRRGRAYGFELQDTDWRGPDSSYTWLLADGRTVSLPQDELNHFHKLEEVKLAGAAVGATLLDAQFIGMSAIYNWQTPVGVSIKSSLKKLKARVEKVLASHAHKHKMHPAFVVPVETPDPAHYETYMDYKRAFSTTRVMTDEVKVQIYKGWMGQFCITLLDKLWRGGSAKYTWRDEVTGAILTKSFGTLEIYLRTMKRKRAFVTRTNTALDALETAIESRR